MAAAALKPQADTVRVVGWDELPPSVREIPAQFDAAAEGVLMEHQRKWVAMRAVIKVAEKGRRTGITFAEALDDTITAASRKSAGGDNVYYIPDVKDKGLEFIGYCARFARVIAQAQGQGVSAIEEFLFEDQQEDGSTRKINAYRIRFASGFQVVALSSRPANIRGLQGIVVIDEAAYHANVQAVLEAATALLIWGGQIRIISTHNGRRNPFNQLIRDIQNGLYGADAKVLTITFDDAVTSGLYERSCYLKGDKATPEGKAAWYARIRNAYGPRKAAMREELDAVPRDGGGKSIPGVWIDRAMPEVRPIVRLVLDDEFVHRPEEERKEWCKEWIRDNIEPLLAKLEKGQRHVVGQDFARHRHFSIITPLAITQTLKRSAPFVVEMSNVPWRQQEQILWAILAGVPRLVGVGLDATGPGTTMAEYAADRFGATLVHQVVLNRQWYGLWMPKMVQGFEDGTFELPRDVDLDGDLRAVEEIDGIPMVPHVDAKDIKDPDLYRHGDFAISLALAHFASLNMSGSIDFIPVPAKRSRWDADPEARDFDDNGENRDNQNTDMEGAW